MLISQYLILSLYFYFFFFFFFNDTATTEIYTRKDTLSLHDALPISPLRARPAHRRVARGLRHPERASCGPWRHDGVALLRGHVPAHSAIRGVGLLELPPCSRARHGRLSRHDAAIPRRARAPLRGSRGGQEIGAPDGREVRGGGGQEARDLGPRGRP